MRYASHLIQSPETHTGSKVTYRLLCHGEQKHVFGNGGKRIASSSSLFDGGESARPAKCIIIKVNYTIQDAFSNKANITTKTEYDTRKENINDKLIRKRREKKKICTFSRPVDLNVGM